MIQTSDIHILGKHFPGLPICTDRHFQAVSLIQQFHPEVFTDLVGYRQRLFLSSVHHEILSIGCYSRVGFFIVVQQQTSDISISQSHFDFRFITFVHGCNQQQATICRSESLSLHLHFSLRKCQSFGSIFLPERPLKTQFRFTEIIR